MLDFDPETSKLSTEACQLAVNSAKIMLKSLTHIAADNPKTPKPQIINQNLSEIKKCEINICVPSKGMVLYEIIIIAQSLIR